MGIITDKLMKSIDKIPNEEDKAGIRRLLEYLEGLEAMARLDSPRPGRYLMALSLYCGYVLQMQDDKAFGVFLETMFSVAGVSVMRASATPAGTDPGVVATTTRLRHADPSRTEARAGVIAHTLTDTEYRYSNRNKDAQTVRDLYRGKGHKRVDVYSPDGDLLQSVEVEP